MILALCMSGCANKKGGLKIILPQWKEAWNSGDLSKIVSLYHPKSKTVRLYNSDNESRKEGEIEFNEMIDEYGKIEKWEIGEYNKSEKQYNVRITYTKKGTRTVFFSVAKDSNGTWLIMSINFMQYGIPL